MKNKVMLLVVAALVAGGLSVWAEDVQVITSSATAIPVTASGSGVITVSGNCQPGVVSISTNIGGGHVEIHMMGSGGGSGQAMGFATASAMLAKPVARTWLGVGTDGVSDDLRAQLPLAEGTGLIVRHVDPDSPASKAGIQENDIITKLDDQVLVNNDQLRQLVQMHKEGETVTLTALRKGKETKSKATLVKKETADEGPHFGVLQLGPGGSNLKMEIPAEIRKLIEQHGGKTIFSTNIVHKSISTSTSGPVDAKEMEKAVEEAVRKAMEQIKQPAPAPATP